MSNCRSRFSSTVQRNLYIKMKQTFAARDKFMLIIDPSSFPSCADLSYASIEKGSAV